MKLNCSRILGTVLVATYLAAISTLPARGQTQSENLFEKDISSKARIKYLLFLPTDYGKTDKQWPVMLFLHGSGESGDDLSKVKAHGPAKIVETQKDFPFIVVSPQSSGRGWSPDVLNALLDDIVTKYKVDKDRIYLTGLSMGGYGTWALGAAHPERFAALVPICGGGNPADASKLKNIPIWVFHGGKDNAVPLEQSERMVKAIKEAGGNIQFTVYPEAGHDSWTETYNNPKLYEWLLEQKRKSH